MAHPDRAVTLMFLGTVSVWLMAGGHGLVDGDTLAVGLSALVGWTLYQFARRVD